MSAQEDILEPEGDKPEILTESIETVLEEDSVCEEKSESILEESVVNDDENSVNVKDNIESENLVVPEETNEHDSTEKISSSKSRELKSILALSKEAKLDTNLPAKRKESTRKRDFAKLHSIGLSVIEKSPSSKSNQDNSKAYKFPVTAESELEEDSFSKPYSRNSMESPKPLKRSRTPSSSVGDESSKKSRRFGSGQINMFKVIESIYFLFFAVYVMCFILNILHKTIFL